MKRFLFLLSSVTLFAAAASGASLRGVVTDRQGIPLPGVSIVTDIQGIGTMSLVDGSFALESGDATRVTFSSVGYQPRQFSVNDLPDSVRMAVLFHETEGIIVTADRAKSGVDAIAYASLTSDDIARDYSVGEFPLLLASTPNTHVFTDGGAPLGYSYLKIRGFNDQRIATYINGVPLNDPEDHFTYFVDLPDFGSSITDIQVQRGVGNSLYGDASFGGSINIATNVFAEKQGTRLTTGYGEFTHNGSFYGSQISKQSLEFASGLVDGQWAYYGRFSRQSTSGYRSNSWYNGWAYYLAVGRLDPRMSTELHIYGGPIRMHLSYFGVDRATLEANRLSNPLTYANETDNFNQPHYQIHNRFFINDDVTLSNTIYYIRGKGFFEQFKSNRTYSEYNLASLSDSSSGDLVRRKWVEKNQFGWNPRLDIDHDRGRHTVGGSVYLFNSNHWGQVISAEHLNNSVNPSHRYYQYFGDKIVASLYATERYQAGERFTIQATAQLRYSRFDFDQVKKGAFLGHEFTVDWLFFSPRLGVSYSIAPGTNLYANVALSSRAPNDDNVYDADDPDTYPLLEVKSNSGDTLFSFGDPINGAERAYDIEAGLNKRSQNYAYAVNLFWLLYDNEYLFDFGADALDSSTTLTIPRSIHSGIELSGSIKATTTLALSGDFSYNFNRIVDFTNNFGGSSVSFDDKTLPGFPEYIGGFIIDVTPGNWRITGRGKFVGKQYMEPENISEFVIDPYFNSSLSASYRIDNFISIGALTISGRINNLFDNKYIVSGYGGNFLGSGGEVLGWAEYFVAPERSFWGQVALDL